MTAVRRLTVRSQRWHNPDLSWQTGLVLIAPGLCLLGVFFLWPVGHLIADSFNGFTSTANYRKVFDSSADTKSLIRTFVSSLLVTVLSVVLGGYLAWEMRTGGKLKRGVIAALVIFPLLTSVPLRMYALTIVLGHDGVVNELLQDLHLTSQPAAILYTNYAVWIGMLYTLLPYAVLPLYAGFSTIDLDLVRAARSLGASTFRAFATVIAPLSVASVIATSCLCFVLSLGFYVTPIALGSSSRPFAANRIAGSIFVFYDVRRAAAACVILLVGALLSVALTVRVVGLRRIQRAVVS